MKSSYRTACRAVVIERTLCNVDENNNVYTNKKIFSMNINNNSRVRCGRFN